MGLALLVARHFETEAEQIVVWDGEATAGLAGTAVDVANWRHSGRPSKIDVVGTGADGANSAPRQVGGRRTRAMLFGDIHGYSKMTDTQLPVFVDKVSGSSPRFSTRTKQKAICCSPIPGGMRFTSFSTMPARRQAAPSNYRRRWLRLI